MSLHVITACVCFIRNKLLRLDNVHCFTDLIEAIFEDVNNSGELTSHSAPQVESHQSLPQQTSPPSRQSSSSSQLHSPHHSLTSHHSLVSQQPLSPQQQELPNEVMASLDPYGKYLCVCIAQCTLPYVIYSLHRSNLISLM